MNIYRATDAPFPSTFLEYAQVFADHAAVAVANITCHANASERSHPPAESARVPGNHRAGSKNTRWWPPFCATTDWVAAAILAGAIAIGADLG